MTGTVCKYYVLKQHFSGMPKQEDLELKEKVLRPIIDGEFLVQSHFLSVDPYMRVYTRQLKEGAPMIGGGIGKIIESKNADFPVGTIVTGLFGWSTHFLAEADVVKQQAKMFRKLPNDVNMSHGIGVLGLTGLTAYFGLLDICDPKDGETVFVNTAAGAVGNVVGQIAKIKGCRVVGCAGSEEKLDYLRELGFDGVFNYKTCKLDATLKELCPKGIDCFFDNVGGEMFDVTMSHMNRYGRASLCGSISTYNETDPSKLTSKNIHMFAIPKEIKIQGFMAPSFYDRFDEAFNQLREWISQDKLKVTEHIVEGFENMPNAFIGLFTGNNIGKVVIKL